MYFNAICIKCMEEKNDDKLNEYKMELRDNRVYPLTCKREHETVVILKNNTFELLFDMGIYALNDGYSREAVANFAAATERFHEFCIAIMAKEKLIPVTFMNEFDVSWKSISSQSERQLGAFIMLYLTTFKRSPYLLSDKTKLVVRNDEGKSQTHTEFRNSVIHKGKFPRREETINYAEDTFNYIKSKLTELKTTFSDSVEYVYEKQLRDYLTSEDVGGKCILDHSELTTFQSLRPLEEIEMITFENTLKERGIHKAFK